MVSVGQAVPVGPFTGGLNSYSDPSSIGDKELVLCQNFEVDVDGSLKSRPPIVDRGTTLPLATSGNMRLLGVYYKSDGSVYQIASDGNSSTYYLNNGTWTLISNGVAAVDIVQVSVANGSILYLLPPIGSGTGGSWDGTTFTQDANMPHGVSITAIKSRLFIATGAGSPTPSRVYYSAILGNTLWQSTLTANAFFEVGAGDGQTNVALVQLANGITIFRSNSIWTFNYSTDPGQGVQAVAVPNIGLASRQAIDIFQGIVYFMFNGRAYTFTNGVVQQINQRVPFTTQNRVNNYLPFAVSVFALRVFYAYYDTVYVFSLITQTWSTWKTATYTGIGKIVAYTGATTGDAPTGITHSNVVVGGTSGRTAKTLYITDTFSAEVETGGYACVLQTKTYDYGTPGKFKRLFWWGVSLIYRSTLTGTVTPVIYSQQVTWSQVRTRTWGALRAATWGQPLIQSLSVSTPYSQGGGNVRKYARFPRSMRFQHAYYTISTSIDGSINTSPCRIFSVDTTIAIHGEVARALT